MAPRVWIELETTCVSVRRGSRETTVRETWMIALTILAPMVGNATTWTITSPALVYQEPRACCVNLMNKTVLLVPVSMGAPVWKR